MNALAFEEICYESRKGESQVQDPLLELVGQSSKNLLMGLRLGRQRNRIVTDPCFELNCLFVGRLKNFPIGSPGTFSEKFKYVMKYYLRNVSVLTELPPLFRFLRAKI